MVYLNQMATAAIHSLPTTPETKSTDLLFHGVAGPRFSVQFIRVCKRIGISDFSAHDLRHTAASWMRMKGADIHTVAQLLGHKDLRMAARYQHLSPSFLAEAVGRLDEAYAEEKPKQKRAKCHRSVTAPKMLKAGNHASA